MAASVVTHYALIGVGNGYASTAQSRPFRLNLNRLGTGDGKTWTRVLGRVDR